MVKWLYIIFLSGEKSNVSVESCIFASELEHYFSKVHDFSPWRPRLNHR